MTSQNLTKVDKETVYLLENSKMLTKYFWVLIQVDKKFTCLIVYTFRTLELLNKLHRNKSKVSEI